MSKQPIDPYPKFFKEAYTAHPKNIWAHDLKGNLFTISKNTDNQFYLFKINSNLSKPPDFIPFPLNLKDPKSNQIGKIHEIQFNNDTSILAVITDKFTRIFDTTRDFTQYVDLTFDSTSGSQFPIIAWAPYSPKLFATIDKPKNMIILYRVDFSRKTLISENSFTNINASAICWGISDSLWLKYSLIVGSSQFLYMIRPFMPKEYEISYYEYTQLISTLSPSAAELLESRCKKSGKKLILHDMDKCSTKCSLKTPKLGGESISSIIMDNNNLLVAMSSQDPEVYLTVLQFSGLPESECGKNPLRQISHIEQPIPISYDDIAFISITSDIELNRFDQSRTISDFKLKQHSFLIHSDSFFSRFGNTIFLSCPSRSSLFMLRTLYCPTKILEANTLYGFASFPSDSLSRRIAVILKEDGSLSTIDITKASIPFIEPLTKDTIEKQIAAIKSVELAKMAESLKKQQDMIENDEKELKNSIVAMRKKMETLRVESQKLSDDLEQLAGFDQTNFSFLIETEEKLNNELRKHTDGVTHHVPGSQLRRINKETEIFLRSIIHENHNIRNIIRDSYILSKQEIEKRISAAEKKLDSIQHI